MIIRADVIVIGGGSTGTGIARDLALRGIKPLLLEKGDFASGTTGGCQGLVHSGCRYVVTDPSSAKECITENRILRRIASGIIEDIQALYISLPEDGLEYQAKLLEMCHQVGIQVDRLSPREALKIEPNLSPELVGAVKTPDFPINPFLLVLENAREAMELGGTMLNHAEVVGFIVEGGKVKGVRFLDTRRRDVVEARAEFIINSAGAWVDRIISRVGLSIPVTYSKGTTLVFAHRISEAFLSRCREPSDGDAFVPHESTGLWGTTSIRVDTPNQTRVERYEVVNLLTGLGKLIPTGPTSRLLRAYAGVRPLYEETGSEDDRNISRDFTIIDHEKKDGLEGILSVVGGKMCTYRLMAEKTVNFLCQKLGVSVPCTTHLKPLPRSRNRKEPRTATDRLSTLDPLRQRTPQSDRIICECELVNRQEIVEAITEADHHDLKSIMIRTRSGMGPCQGTFCAYKIIGIIAELGDAFHTDLIHILKEFLDRRWKGICPVVADIQLREVQLTEGIYAGIFNLDKI